MYIPYYQPLSPLIWLSREQQHTDHRFPLDAPNAIYFDFARQGIYCVGKKLRSSGLGHLLFPTYHCGMELYALRAAGVELTFYNIHRSGNIDFSDLEAKISPNIDGLYFIHYNGFPQDSFRILELKQQYGLKLLEDAAVALFSQSTESNLGELGDVSFFSLYKTLSVPTGGLVVARDPQLLPEIPRVSRRSSKGHLMLARMHADWAAMYFPGLGRLIYKSRRKVSNGDDSAALDTHLDSDMSFSSLFRSLIRRNNFDRVISKRRSNYATLLNSFSERGLGKTPMYSHLPDGVVPSFFPVFVDRRKEIRDRLAEKGIESVAFWQHRLPGVPYSADVVYLKDHVLGLPIHQGLNERHLEYMAEVLRGVLRETGS